MNKEHKDDVLQSVRFSEEETRQLLEGAPYETFSESMKSRTKLLGLDGCLPALPRNIGVLLKHEAEFNGEAPAL